MKTRPRKVVIAINTAWNLVNFRSGLIRALVGAGYEVVAVAPWDDYAARLPALGCRYLPLPMDNKGVHPGRDIALFWRFWRPRRRLAAILLMTAVLFLSLLAMSPWLPLCRARRRPYFFA